MNKLILNFPIQKFDGKQKGHFHLIAFLWFSNEKNLYKNVLQFHEFQNFVCCLVTIFLKNRYFYELSTKFFQFICIELSNLL